MIVRRVPISTAAPFDLPAVKAHLRIDRPDDDEALESTARAVVAELEGYAQLALLDQSITVSLPAWPSLDDWPLPVAPLLDPASLSVTIAGTPFAEFGAVPGLRPALYPTGIVPEGRVVIGYTAGFGPSWADIPADLRLAILDQVAAAYDWRGNPEMKGTGLSPHTARIAARYRRVLA
jgi:uncharacterized phiE125 gp8 family phage protein